MDLPIVADASIALTKLVLAIKKKIVKREETAWYKRVQEIREQFRDGDFSGEKGIQSNIVRIIRKIMPHNGILTTEVGKNQMWGELYYKVIEPRTWITSTGLGTMGFGFPAAIGAKVAKPDVPVVDLAGDGSFRMTENALSVCVDENIPVVVVILNNSSFGMVEQWQRLFYNRRYSAVKLGSSPDFVQLAQAYGAQGFRTDTADEFSKVFKKAINSDIVTVIDCPVPPEEDVYPFVPPGKALTDVLYKAER